MDKIHSRIVIDRIKEIEKKYKLEQYYESSNIGWYVSVIFGIIMFILIMTICIISPDIEFIILTVVLIIILSSIIISPHKVYLDSTGLNVGKKKYELQDIESIQFFSLMWGRYNTMKLYMKETKESREKSFNLTYQNKVDIEALVYFIHYMKNNLIENIVTIDIEDMKDLESQYRIKEYRW